MQNKRGTPAKPSRPQVTIEGTARARSNATSETRETKPGDTATDTVTEQSSTEPTAPSGSGPVDGARGDAASERGRGPIGGLLRLLATVLATTIIVFAILALLRVGGDTTRSAARFLTSGDDSARTASELSAEIAPLRALPERLTTLETTLSGLDTRVSVLTDRFDAIDAALAQVGETQSADTARLDGLAVRADTLDQRVDGVQPTLADLDTRVTTLRDQLDAAAATGTNAEAVAARLTTEAARIAALVERVSGIEGALETLEKDSTARASDAAATDPAIADIRSALAETRAALASVQARGALTALHATWLAFSGLRDRAEAGRPFTAELSAMRVGAGLPFDLAAISAHADQPPPSRIALLVSLAALPAPQATPRPAPAEPAPSAAAQGSEPQPQVTPQVTGFWQRLLDQAGSAVTVRRTRGDAATPRAPSGSASDAETLEEAVARLETLDTTPQRQAWLDQARARISLDASLEKIAGELQTRLQSAEAG